MSENDQWYYASGEQRLGPVTAQTLRHMAAMGQLQPGVLVWRAGMADWAPAGSMPELFPQAAPVTAQPQPGATLPDAGGTIPMTHGGTLDYFHGMNVTYGGFWRRFGAYFLDSLIVYAPFFILQLVLNTSMNTVTTTTTPGPGGTFTTGATATSSFALATGCGMGLLQLIAFWLYFALQESSGHQATLGKRALGLYVTDQMGARISFGQASGRHFAKIVSGLILYIGFIMAAFTERKQGLHDMMAGTLVLQRN